MKIQTIASTCALIIGFYGMTPAVAESFQDRGSGWAATGSMPTATSSKPRTLSPDGSFSSGWGSGITATQYQGQSSSSAGFDLGQNCDLTAKIGFNQDNNFPMC